MPTRAKTAASEADLWKVQSTIAEAALDFAIAFLGCRKGPNKNEPIDSAARARLLAIVRAVSIAESRHGTVGANQPKRDPFQCGNPNDSWWKEFCGLSGNGSRFVRGPGLTNLWAKEVGDAAEPATGFPPAAKRSALAVLKDGHKNTAFTPTHSYVWGIIYLIHRINSEAGDQTFSCGDLSRSRLIDGAVTYNGGGVSDYKNRLERALAEFGDPLAIQLSASAKTAFVSELVNVAKSAGQPLASVEADFDPISGQITSIRIGFAAAFNQSGLGGG